MMNKRLSCDVIFFSSLLDESWLRLCYHFASDIIQFWIPKKK